jgi:hypothetical protein
MPTDPDPARQVLFSLPGIIAKPTSRKLSDLSSHFEKVYQANVSLQVTPIS